VAVDVAEADRATGVQPPAVVELHVHVGVERTVGRQAVQGPVVPVVEVPVESLVDPVRLVPPEREPVGPRLLIGTTQEPEVVELEPCRTPTVAGLEPGPLAAQLAETNLGGCTGERGTFGIEREVIIRAL